MAPVTWDECQWEVAPDVSSTHTAMVKASAVGFLGPGLIWGKHWQAFRLRSLVPVLTWMTWGAVCDLGDLGAVSLLVTFASVLTFFSPPLLFFVPVIPVFIQKLAPTFGRPI